MYYLISNPLWGKVYILRDRGVWYVFYMIFYRLCVVVGPRFPVFAAAQILGIRTNPTYVNPLFKYAEHDGVLTFR
jgi:hypothetical protein